jgi:chromosome segregation protein
LRVAAAQERQRQIVDQQNAIENELKAAVDQVQSVTHSLGTSRQRLDQLQLSVAQAEARMADNTRRIDELDAARQLRNRDCLSAQVELARSEQQLDHLRGQLRRYEQDRSERERSIAEAGEQFKLTTDRRQQAETDILSAESELAELYLQGESLSGEAAGLSERRTQARADRVATAQVAQQHRAAIHAIEEQLHESELAAGEVRHQRATLESRLREDYSLELAELADKPQMESEPQQPRQEIDAEIADLRRKLTNIGGVNLDSLAEVEELETRFQSLSAQHEDLSKAKESLAEIINRINGESRRLFSETLETVKGHFQQLFRKLFGGGQADIVLEEDADILESGIEIVARPPGKEPRSISLLSGGEKTLTCVALLLAIFRSRPSPFCVLDEVDAALDEANIERFVGVLKEFLEWTQFVVVTHSKKTMAFASTLYGITMQESGVSKRVSVRFDDVSETGQISREAIERDSRQIASPAPVEDSATEAA